MPYLKESYGGLKTKMDHHVVDEGCDWVLIKHRGTLCYVPKPYISYSFYEERKTDYEDELEFIA